MPRHIPFYQLDLNNYHAVEKFSEQKKNAYDLIISMETIEHIENPWLLFRLLKNICKPGGYILLTTPNIESTFSRFCFLFTSKFQHFRKENLLYGYINPLTSFEIKHTTDSLGLKLESIIPIGTYPLIYLHKKIIDSIIWTIVNLVLYPFLKGYKTGWCLCYCIKKIDSPPQSSSLQSREGNPDTSVGKGVNQI